MFGKLKQYIRRVAGNLRMFRINREFLVFLVFLLVAVIFWFLQTFKDNTSVNLTFDFELVGVPKNMIWTSDLPQDISVTVTGRGFSIIDYLTKPEKRKLVVDYSTLVDDGDKVIIDNNTWKRLLTRALGSSLKYTAVNPPILELYYSTGAHKYVPVEFGGRVKVEDQHVLCGIDITPLYVDIYAPDALFDTLSVIRTEKVTYTQLKDTMQVRLALAPPRGVKCDPDSVTATICVDLFTTKKMQLPVFTEHVPDNIIVRPFPSTISVTFRVSSSLYADITDKDFAVVVDYDNIKPGDQRLPLILRSQPEGISNVQMSPNTVEYIIERQ